GQAVVELGGGRSRPGQALDHAVGLAEVLGCGSAVQVGQPLAIIHARHADAAEAAQRKVARAFRITSEPAPSRPLWQWHMPAEQFA
ncbi:thymidine phosphorylase, partial [Rhodanobacter thiooxydans LCS2]